MISRGTMGPVLASDAGMKSDRSALFACLLAVTALLSFPAGAEAGCGCAKPPPAVAPVRPHFASPGNAVTLIADGLVAGASYVATFHAFDGVEVSVDGVAVSKRDFADGVVKAQLVVAAPDLVPGPATITVTPLGGGAPLLQVAAEDFTMLQAALPLSETNGKTEAQCYRAAVANGGVVYFPFDISEIADEMIFEGRAGGYRLTFRPEDIVIYNTQGVTMQLLDPAVVGLYTIDDGPDVEDDSTGTNESGPDSGTNEWDGSSRSFRLTYDRHEFRTYNALHVDDPGHAPDPTDPDWHVDGSRHFDHNHIVLAVHGLIDQTTPPPPGATPTFTFRVKRRLSSGSSGDQQNTILQWIPSCTLRPEHPVKVTAPGCSAAPFVGCRSPQNVRSTRLEVTDKSKNTQDTLVWKWANGQKTPIGSFGDPLDSDGMSLCLYDESGATPVLVFEAGLPPNQGCQNATDHACWKASRSSYRYLKKDGKPDGIADASAKPGTDGRAHVIVKGRGSHLTLPALPFSLPVRAQLQSATGQCWDAVFGQTGVNRNDPTRFRGRAD
jgi:hypothetical protein